MPNTILTIKIKNLHETGGSVNQWSNIGSGEGKLVRLEPLLSIFTVTP